MKKIENKEKLSHCLSVNQKGELIFACFGEDYKVNGLTKKQNFINFIHITSKKHKSF